LAHCARLAQQWGYEEVNLNCGCPSERVQRGSFGACLMAEPQLVADCVAAMREACTLPVTVKHRIGIDRIESFDFVAEFVGTVAARGGCGVFVVHARNAWLHGLSPKENREVPPLRYDIVYRLKAAFPHLTVVLNGGVETDEQIDEHLAQVDGVMLGRRAYHEPWAMAGWDSRFFGGGAAGTDAPSRDAVEEQMVRYMERIATAGEPWGRAARHIVGLRNGQPGARRWRQAWSDPTLRRGTPEHAMAAARAGMARVQNELATAEAG
jgi:tRNA-dihydrouridine synthase A